MNDSDSKPATPPGLGLRAVQTVVLLIGLYIAGWLLAIVSLVQLFAAAINGHANAQLGQFGNDLGRYIAQIAAFGSFASDEPPFPFGNWPAQA